MPGQGLNASTASRPRAWRIRSRSECGWSWFRLLLQPEARCLRCRCQDLRNAPANARPALLNLPAPCAAAPVQTLNPTTPANGSTADAPRLARAPAPASGSIPVRGQRRSLPCRDGRLKSRLHCSVRVPPASGTDPAFLRNRADPRIFQASGAASHWESWRGSRPSPSQSDQDRGGLAPAYNPPLDLTARALNPCDSGGRRSQKAPVNADQTPGQRASNPPESLKRARIAFFCSPLSQARTRFSSHCRRLNPVLRSVPQFAQSAGCTVYSLRISSESIISIEALQPAKHPAPRADNGYPAGLMANGCHCVFFQAAPAPI